MSWYGMEICRTEKNTSKNEFVFHPAKVLQNMLYVPWNLKLKHTLTWFYLVVKLPCLIIFFRPT